MKAVAIVDDHPVIAETVALELARREIADTVIIDIASPNAREDLANCKPDLCLIDLDLGQQSPTGMEFLQEAILQQLAAMMITGATDGVALGHCLETGALGIIPKKLGFGVVIDLIERALNGEAVNSDSEMLHWILAAQRDRADRRRELAPFQELTCRESAVLQHLIEGERVEAIARTDYVSVATVRSQVHSILHKLGVQCQLGAVAAARRAGWPGPQSQG